MAAWTARAGAQSKTPADSYDAQGCPACADAARRGDYGFAAELFKEHTIAVERASHEPSAVDKFVYPQGKAFAECEEKVSDATRGERNQEQRKYEAKLDQVQQENDEKFDQAQREWAARVDQIEQDYQAKLARLKRSVRAQCPKCDFGKL